jgi:hypothetical protein
MELQKSVGGLVATVESLRTDVKGQGEKIDKLRLWVAKIVGGAVVIGAILWAIPSSVRQQLWTKLFG